jgi:hypothetical protein
MFRAPGERRAISCANEKQCGAAVTQDSSLKPPFKPVHVMWENNSAKVTCFRASNARNKLAARLATQSTHLYSSLVRPHARFSSRDDDPRDGSRQRAESENRLCKRQARERKPSKLTPALYKTSMRQLSDTGVIRPASSTDGIDDKIVKRI